MKKLVCMYSGWFEIDVEDVRLTDTNSENGETKTAAEWLAERGNIDKLCLESFEDAFRLSTDGEFSELDISIEDDED